MKLVVLNIEVNTITLLGKDIWLRYIVRQQINTTIHNYT